MPKSLVPTRTLITKLGGIALLLLLIWTGQVAVNSYTLSELRGDAAAVNFTALGRALSYRTLYMARRLHDETPEGRTRLLADLDSMIAEFERRPQVLLHGNAALGIRPTTDPQVVGQIQEREKYWRTSIRPLLERLAAAGSRATEAERDLSALDRAFVEYHSNIDNAVTLLQRRSEEKVERFQLFQVVGAGIVLIILGLLIWISRNIAGRARVLALTAERIADGNLDLVAPVAGADEIAKLGQSFNRMTATLRQMIVTEKEARAGIEKLLLAVAETANSLGSATSEILAGTKQQASGAQEQAAAVTQTMATVDEVVQTADQAADRAKAAAEAAQRTAEIGGAGRDAVEGSIDAMGKVREQAESIADNILSLAEQAQAIGEIIATVNDIAEQTNLLALNAAIEASRAGEHGGGFTVVAREIKELAGQSKKATGQVRKILGEIQGATNTAVIVAEEGTKSVSAAIAAITKAGETIRELVATIDGMARAAVQIAASAGQQATGLAQIRQSMRDINQAATQNMAATRQAEKAASDLNALGTSLRELMRGFGR